MKRVIITKGTGHTRLYTLFFRWLGSCLSGCMFLFLPFSAYAEWQFSGVADSTARSAWGYDYGEGGKGYTGLEEFANLRLKAPVGEQGMVFAAVNLAAASGTALSLVPAGQTGTVAEPYVSGKGYASALELERLYIRLEGEETDLEAGLLRIPFGFGQAFRPTDFLNPPNPLFPDARPRGSLGAVYTMYPTGLCIVRLFYVGGEDPLKTTGAGVIGGVSGEIHGPKASAQGFYVFQAPGGSAGAGVGIDGGLVSSIPSSRPIHRFGLAIKLESEASFVLDALYNWYDRSWTGWQGLQAALGVDYSILKGKLIMVVQYLYNGQGTLNPGDRLSRLYEPDAGRWEDVSPEERTLRSDIPIGELNRKNYLNGGATYQFSDYTRATFSCTAGLDDGSLVPLLSVEHEPLQGLLVSASFQIFLDGKALGYGSYGELGPAHAGKWGELTLKARVRF
ncbi:MAG: hypothetical protein Kow009_03490 [Spirochaetales bacterium]